MRSVQNFNELIICRLGFMGGLRPGEIVKVRYIDFIEVQGSAPVVHVKEGKGGKSRYACIDDGTANLIRCHMDGVGADPTNIIIDRDLRTLERWFKKILERSGIVRIEPTPHTMRHTNITMLLSHGMPIEKVQGHAGHESITTTQLYEHLTYMDRSRAYDQIIGE